MSGPYGDGPNTPGAGGGAPDPERDALIEQAASAWRPEGREGGPRGHPAWHDLDAAGREAAFERAMAMRELEAALDPEGLSTTARAVLARIRVEAR